MHTRRAGRDAGHAAQAAIEMLDHRAVEPDSALIGEFHQVDPPAGRVHLLAPEQVGGAGRQAEAAVDAVVDELGIGRMVIVEGPGRGGVQFRASNPHQMPPINRPGFNVA